MKLLIVEDDKRLCSILSEILEKEGYIVQSVHEIEALKKSFFDFSFDGVILDLVLGDGDGLDALAEMRYLGISVPVLILSGNTGMSTKVRGLDLGADDYLTKPFMPSEFKARIRAMLRRAPVDLVDRFMCGDLEVNASKQMACVGGRMIELSQKEYRLLEYLVFNKGNIVSRQDILKSVWGVDLRSSGNRVDVYIRYLRKKLKGISSTKIKTLHGIGYMIEEGQGSKFRLRL